MTRLLSITATSLLAFLAAPITDAVPAGEITYGVQSDGNIGIYYDPGEEADPNYPYYGDGDPAYSACYLAAGSPQYYGGATSMGPLSGDFAANKTLKFDFIAPAGKRFVVNPPAGATTRFYAILSTGAYGYPYRYDGALISWNFLGVKGTAPTFSYSYVTYAQHAAATELIIHFDVPQGFSFTGFTATASVPAEFNHSLVNASTHNSHIGFGAEFEVPFAPNPGQWVVLEDIEQPKNEVTLGQQIANIPGSKITLMYAPEVADDGTLYLRTQLSGTGVHSGNNTALVRWNGEEATALVREGELLAEKPIASFGDPLVENTSVYFSARLKVGNGVASTNDFVLARHGTNGVTVLLREGDPAVGVDGYKCGEAIWIHPTSGGLFFSATIMSISSAAKQTAVWYHNGQETTLKAVTGGTVQINGATRTIKSIAKPSTSGVSNNQTRVGNKEGIALIIATTDRVTAMKRFNP